MPRFSLTLFFHFKNLFVMKKQLSKKNVDFTKVQLTKNETKTVKGGTDYVITEDIIVS